MATTDMQSSGFDADAARYDRNNRTQQAPFAPGQGDMFSQGADSVFSQSTVPNNTGAMNDIFSSSATTGMGGDIFSQSAGGMVAGANGMTQPNMTQQQPPKDAADVFWEAVGKGFKGGVSVSKGFFGDLFGSFGQLTALWWYKYAFKGAIASICVCAFGVVSKMFGLGSGLQIAIGSLLSLAFYSVLFFMKYDAAKACSGLYSDGSSNIQPVSPEPSMDLGGTDPVSGGFSFGDDPMGFTDSPTNDGFGSFGDLGDPEDEDPYEEDEPGDWEELGFGEESQGAEPQAGMSHDEALASLPDVPKGMYERRYLYDMFTKVLPTMKPDFSEMREIDNDDDVFLLWGERLIEAATCAGCKEDYLPELTELHENLFTVVVTCTRPQNCKPDLIGAELANIYAYGDGTERNDNIFAKVDTVGSTIKITLFNGASSMISLKDMMLQETDFVLDNKNYIPVIIGVNQLGKVIKVDMKKLESIIVTGMPRSGKSWLVQAILTQMCAFVPPSELNIYICDPKEGISDFKGFCLPHVKKFVSGDNNIVATLRDLVKREAPRRKRIIGDANFVNIWDFKEKHPDVKLPIIYVVVDEVVTLASRMDKETNNEFRMLLRELISQLPALGIRAFLIPHILNNEIIEKKTSDLVPCKISVCGDADHIEKATGSKFKDFPYRLVNKGDMAVKLMGYQNTLFVHGPALTSSNPENNDLFDYLRRVWTKLDPDEIPGSYAEQIGQERDIADAATQVLETDFSEEDLDLF